MTLTGMLCASGTTTARMILRMMTTKMGSASTFAHSRKISLTNAAWITARTMLRTMPTAIVYVISLRALTLAKFWLLECHAEITSFQKIRATARPMAFVLIASVLVESRVAQMHVLSTRPTTLTMIIYVVI
jgi:hypothetical protein